MPPWSIRPARPDDRPALFHLNDTHVPHVGELSPQRFNALIDLAPFTHVAVNTHDHPVAFLVGMLPSTPYTSPNFRWFVEHTATPFAYCDRVAVAAHARRQGLAARLYHALATFGLAHHATQLTCEINLLPPNPTSMHAHQRLGFTRIGTLAHIPGEKEVAMMTRAISPAPTRIPNKV